MPSAALTSSPAQRARGIAEILLSGVCFGFLGYFGKRAYSEGLTPGELLSLRFLISALILGALFFAAALRNRMTSGTWRSGLKATGREIFWCSILGIGGYAAFATCYFSALQHLTASLTVLLLYLYPIFVTLGAHFFLGERIRAGSAIALALSTLGLLLLVGGDLTGGPFPTGVMGGYLFGLGSAIIYAAYILVSRAKLSNVSPWKSIFYIQLSAGIVLALGHLRGIGPTLDILTRSWATLLGISLVCSLAAMTLFLSGLQKLKSSEVSILSTSEPLTAVVVAALVLGERLSPAQYTGGVLVLGGLLLLSKKSAD